jgi:hypothetical protein
VNIIRMNMLVFVGRMMFGGIVAQVLLARSIVESEELLGFIIKEPKVAHFHSLGMLAFDGVVHNADSCGVVNVNGNGWLRVTKLFEDKV